MPSRSKESNKYIAFEFYISQFDTMTTHWYLTTSVAKEFSKGQSGPLHSNLERDWHWQWVHVTRSRLKFSFFMHKLEKGGCLCGWHTHNDQSCPNSLQEVHKPSHDTSLLWDMEFGLRTFIVVTHDITGDPCKCIILSKFRVKNGQVTPVKLMHARVWVWKI